MLSVRSSSIGRTCLPGTKSSAIAGIIGGATVRSAHLGDPSNPPSVLRAAAQSCRGLHIPGATLKEHFLFHGVAAGPMFRASPVSPYRAPGDRHFLFHGVAAEPMCWAAPTHICQEPPSSVSTRRPPGRVSSITHATTSTTIVDLGTVTDGTSDPDPVPIHGEGHLFETTGYMRD